jgi:hypothetical protein
MVAGILSIAYFSSIHRYIVNQLEWIARCPTFVAVGIVIPCGIALWSIFYIEKKSSGSSWRP